MSTLLREIYNDILTNSSIICDIEMDSLCSHKIVEPCSWIDLNNEEKKKHIVHYMKRNKIQGDISLYTFKDIRFNKEERKITKLTYCKKA